MRTLRVVHWLLVVLLAVPLLTTGIARAGPAYPGRAITIIVPWAAGGGTDRLARGMATMLEKDLRVPVGVVNRTGGGGAVGHSAGATAAPDGYTLTMVTVEITMMHWLGLTTVALKDFRPVALLNLDAAGISVRADAPWRTYQELEGFIRVNPGMLKASGTAAGGIWDLARAGWLKAADLDVDAVRWVPSTGAAPALAELVAGGVDIVTASLVEALPLIQAGRVRALATMGDRREPFLPDVPTLRELGIKWSIGAWRGIAVPKGTPDDVVRRLEAALQKVVASAEFGDFMRKNGFGVLFKRASDFERFWRDQDTTNGRLLKEVGLAK